MGTVCVAPPTAMPSSTLDSESVSAVGARLQARVPTTNTAEMIRMVRLRPNRSQSARRRVPR